MGQIIHVRCMQPGCEVRGCLFFSRKKLNGGRSLTRDWLALPYLISLVPFLLNWGKSYLATLVTLRDITFAMFAVALFHQTTTKPVFLCQHPLIRKATFDFSWAIFEKLRVPFWRISSNLMKARQFSNRGAKGFRVFPRFPKSHLHWKICSLIC